MRKSSYTQIAALDFETYYSKDYTLKKLSTSLYIFDEQFLVHGLGIRLIQANQTDQTPSTKADTVYYYTDQEIRQALSEIDWSVTAVMAHHAHFDCLILFRHYNIVPAFYLDTLSMARPILQNKLKRLDLDSIARHYKIGGKLAGLEDTKGKRDLTLREQVRLGIYCKNDVDIMVECYDNLILDTTTEELVVISLTVQMYAKPALIVDEWLIDKEIAHILKSKTKLLGKVQTMLPPDLEQEEVASVLRSAKKFALTLEHNGAVVPMKTSKTIGKEAYAFARTDIGFQALGDHRNPKVRDLYVARLAAKSDTALNKAKMLKNFAQAKCCPAYLKYSAAQTMRWSSADKLNMQNLPRAGVARQALMAPEDHVLLVSDLSQIELRMAAWFADQQDVIDIFASGKDVYKDMATKIYGTSYDDVSKDERMVAKVTVLSLGYGAGIKTFNDMLAAGVMGPKVDIPISEVAQIHSTYRRSNQKIVRAWKLCDTWMAVMLTDRSAPPITYKGLTFSTGKVTMPNGTTLQYPAMKVSSSGSVSYQSTNGMTKHIYGALFFENLIQSLARHVIAEQLIAVSKLYDVVLSVHDELVVSVPFVDVERAQEQVLAIMRTSPEWCSDLPLDAEAGWAIEYSK